MVVDYAAEAASHGAVYLEGIFSPAERVRHGCSWEDVFEGVCNGAQEAKELHGVEIRLTPDIPRGFTQEEARATVEWCGAVPRPRRRRRRARRPRGGVPAGAVRGRVRAMRSRSASARCRTRARSRAPRRCAARSRASGPTGSGTASAPRRIPASCGSSPAAAPCSTSARSRTSARAPSPRSPTIRCPASSPPASAARSRRTTRRCSTPTSRRDYEAATSFGLDPRSFYEAGRRRSPLRRGNAGPAPAIGDSFDWAADPSR